MFLTRLMLDPRHLEVQRDLADCYRLHRRILSLYPDIQAGRDARRQLGVLYRPEGYVVLIQSRFPPLCDRLPLGYLLPTGGDPENPAIKDVSQSYAQVHAGMQLAFRLRANPTKKIDSRQDQPGFRPNGRRVDLRREADQVAWLLRKADQHGFRVLRVRVRPDTVQLADAPVQADARPAGKVTGWRRSGEGHPHRLTFGAVLYEGVLEVTNAERFRLALEQGIGPAKAFGFGLLSVAPARR